MWPVLFARHGIVIRSYPAMMYLCVLVALFVAVAAAQGYGLNADRTALAFLILVVPAFIGARLLYVALHWDTFRHEPSRIFRRSDGGMKMYGSLFLTIPLSVPLLWAFDLPFAPFWDATTFAMLAGMAVARVGCLLNGCCSGKPTESWCAVDLPDHRGVWRKRFPSQIIEIVWTLVLLVVLLALRGRMLFAGATFCLGVGAYAAGRFALQGLREDHAGDVGALRRLSVLLAFAAVAGFFALFLWR
jgi:phosphatidylglycerol:prolipoprotein diacylglycerol transferase